MVSWKGTDNYSHVTVLKALLRSADVQVYSESYYWVVPVLNTGAPLQLSTQLPLERGEKTEAVPIK